MSQKGSKGSIAITLPLKYVPITFITAIIRTPTIAWLLNEENVICCPSVLSCVYTAVIFF